MSSVDLGDQRVPVENVQGLRNSDDMRDVRRLARSDVGKRAAAAATADILTSFLGAGATPSVQQKAAEVLNEIAEQEGVTVTQPEATAAVEEEPEAVTDYELPADLEALLDEPDEFEIDDDPEPEAAVETDDDGYVDPEVAKLRRQVEKERRRAEHERKLRVQTARRDWEQEADRVFRLGEVPLLDSDEIKGIKAESRRDFLRQAKEIADRNKQIAQRFQPVRRVERERERAAEVWGAPPAAETAVPDTTGERQRVQLDRARRSGNLANVLKAHLFPDQE